MDLIIGVGIPVIVILVMYIFGLYTHRNFGWVALCLVWGSLSYGAFNLLEPQLLEMGLNPQAINIIISPLMQHSLISLGVFFVLYREKLDNLIDGAVYGFASGLGYAAYENIENGLTLLEQNIAVNDN